MIISSSIQHQLIDWSPTHTCHKHRCYRAWEVWNYKGYMTDSQQWNRSSPQSNNEGLEINSLCSNRIQNQIAVTIHI